MSNFERQIKRNRIRQGLDVPSNSWGQRWKRWGKYVERMKAFHVKRIEDLPILRPYRKSNA